MHNFFLLYDSVCIYYYWAKFHEKILCIGFDFLQNAVRTLQNHLLSVHCQINGFEEIRPKKINPLNTCKISFQYMNK